MKSISEDKFKQYYQSHLKHLTLKGLQPKTIEAYSRAIRRIGDPVTALSTQTRSCPLDGMDKEKTAAYLPVLWWRNDDRTNKDPCVTSEAHPT